MSRLAGLREGYENMDAFHRMASNVEGGIRRRGPYDLGSVEGRTESLNDLYAERRVGAMTTEILQRVGGTMTNQELADARFLLERMARR